MIRRCEKEGRPFGVVWLAKGSEVQVPGESPVLHRVGTLAHSRELTALQPALLQVVCQGGRRFDLESHEAGPFGVWYGQVTLLPEDASVEIPAALQPMADLLGQWIAEAQQTRSASELPLFSPYRLDECGWVANRWAEMLPLPSEGKLQMLAERDPMERLKLAAQYVDF
jgi:Lon protease-like protein